MSELLSELRQDLSRLVVGLTLVAVVAVAFLIGVSRGVAIPVGYALLVALGVALVAGPVATALVCLATCAVSLLSYAVVPVDNWWARFITIVGICALAVAGSVVRRRRDRALTAKTVELAIAHDHDQISRITQQMMDRVPSLSSAADIPGVARQAVRLGRELFDAAACSYWQVDGDECYLVARDPQGCWELGHRLPTASMTSTDVGAARTAFTRRRGLADDDPRAAAMDRGGSAAGSSTTVRVDGVTVAFLALSWASDEERSPTWFDLLDRFGDQVALAKTIVRRRAAQDQAQRLGRRLQRALQPNPTHDAGGVATRSLYRPGTRDLLLGGDFYDLSHRRDSDGCVAFLLGDVSGHGPEQAAVAASLRSAWSALATLPQLTLVDWAAGMQHVLVESDPEHSLFVTCVMGTLDPADGTLRYGIAGHPPPLILGASGVREGEVAGPPLGVFDEVTLTVFETTLDRGSAVLLVTDGIFEGLTCPGSRERVGWDNFLAAVSDDVDYTAEDFLDRLADQMTRRNGAPLPDDVAALLMIVP